MAKKPLTTESDKEADLQQSEKANHKYNIEIPNDLFLEIKEFIKEHGYNLKGFFLIAAKEKIKRQKASE